MNIDIKNKIEKLIEYELKVNDAILNHESNSIVHKLSKKSSDIAFSLSKTENGREALKSILHHENHLVIVAAASALLKTDPEIALPILKK